MATTEPTVSGDESNYDRALGAAREMTRPQNRAQIEQLSNMIDGLVGTSYWDPEKRQHVMCWPEPIRAAAGYKPSDAFRRKLSHYEAV